MSFLYPIDKPSLEQFAGTAPTELHSVAFNGVSPATGYGYRLRFSVGNESNLPHIDISTETKKEYLEKGGKSESSANSGLIDFSQRLRGLSGGVFRIHQFYGGVSGTRTTPIDSRIQVRPADPYSRLATSILLGDNLGSNSDRNPNPRAREIAAVNGFADAWDDEFIRMNGPKHRLFRRTVPLAMEVTPAAITNLLQDLGNQAIFDKVSVESLTVTQNATISPAGTSLHALVLLSESDPSLRL